ncbi:MAG TPA: transporter [Firmicutes bacterium]|jgi:multiple sugar transport system permease protein|nr:transporter [Bacillota bacterium]
MKNFGSKISKFFLFFFPLMLVMLFVLFPFYWTINTAFKRESDIMNTHIQYLPSPWTFHNFFNAWQNIGFSVYFKNSLIVSVLSVILVVLFSILVGYALGRFNFRGKKGFMLTLLCTQFIPHTMLIIPFFLIFKSLGLTSSLWSLIIVYTTFQLPFNSVIMKGFVANIPKELEEAAMVDGCSRLRAIFNVILPILLPGLIATGSFAFIGCWNEFLFALILISKSSRYTIPVGLNFMMGEYDINYGALAAGSVIALIPSVLIFAYVQKYLVQGLSTGAIKG